MKITTEIVQKLNPCNDRFNNFTDKYPNYNGDLEEFITLENITYNDKVWAVTRLFSKEQNIKWAILCASKVLSIFENEYPNDKLPRLALEAAEVYLNDPSEQNRTVADAAATYAADAANAAARAAADAAYAAAGASYAAYAAADAADATADASYASYATYVVYAANAAANAGESRDTEETVNLILMLECI